MKLFRFNKKKSRVTEIDRVWVEENFEWLINIFGYPSRQCEQIIVTKKYFPKTFSTNELKVQNLIEDLCNLFSVDASKIKYELHENLQDIYERPFENEGKPFITHTVINEDSYIILIANSVALSSNQLLFNLIYEFINIVLSENKLEIETPDNNNLYIYIAGIYFGFGVILSQNLTDSGRVDNWFYKTNWYYVSEMPLEVMAFALATYSKLIDQESPKWKEDLHKYIKVEFERSINSLDDSPPKNFNRTELDISSLFYQADQEYINYDFVKAISSTKKILYLTEEKILMAFAHNNIGYYQLRSSDNEKSIKNFQKAIQLNPDFGFAYDNLGYALILTGRLETGRQQLEKALQIKNNDNAYSYSYRNLALYFIAKNQIEKAKAHFKLAFENETVPVDLLELHYANFLFSQGEKGEGLKYLEKAVDKGEPEAIKRMNEYKKEL